MGNLIFSKKTVHLSDDLLNDDEEFVIKINIYTMKTFSLDDIQAILTYLQYTNPVVSYMYEHRIYLLYKPSKISPFLRSNKSGEIISYMSSELTLWLIKNNIEPRMIDIHIEVREYKLLLDELLLKISENNYKGNIYGIETLTNEKIKEEFSY